MDRLTAFFIIHPADRLHFLLLEGKIVVIKTPGDDKDAAELIVPEHPPVKRCLKGSAVLPDIMQVSRIRSNAQFLLQFPQGSPQRLISGRDVSRR